jgi:hypothetical protein
LDTQDERSAILVWDVVLAYSDKRFSDSMMGVVRSQCDESDKDDQTDGARVHASI